MKTKKTTITKKTKETKQLKLTGDEALRDMIEELFFEIVLRLPRIKITDKTMLTDFVPAKDEKWSGHYVSMFCSRTHDILNLKLGTDLSIHHLSNKPLKIIIDYILKHKKAGRRYK